ncbi:nose resistant to fluoxetine protein 6-like isoform X2 [Cydia pomonella]|uniref:nose resistant to fluoxetine protein 6-like isoform X2 n=1 Tax=Cydia pomonella TaxID=82600 RepID=UPI002ADD9AB6|nr:nose resistant to fluoxetine protein 6-like isoform X2 [Cydia pomonella]
MAKLISPIIFVICLCTVGAYIELEVPRHGFDTELYQNVLDEELCEAQLSYLLNNNTLLTAEFLDAGIRLPRGILQGNFVDLGYYHQCLAISENFEPSDIEGKYCMINIPMVQDELNLPVLPEWQEEGSRWSMEGPKLPLLELFSITKPHSDMFRNLQNVRTEAEKYSRMTGPDMDLMRVSEDSSLADGVFKLAVCLPKVCSPKQFIDTVFINTTSVGFKLTEEFCRLRNDKPFAPVDYAAMGVFGFIILITVLSTLYDIYFTMICKEGSKKANTLGKSFSLYTNTRRLLTFNSGPGTLESLDGIRSISMMWVIIGHTYATNGRSHYFNPQEMFRWMFSFSAIWIVASPISVDTFFLLSGLLIVYTTVGKISPKGLFKKLHLFYLHRLLRMFPILATGVFLQASLFNHLSDGPEWRIVVDKVERCRTYWWATLTYVQNYITDKRCIGPSWYLAVDMQLHILSPLILFWVLGTRRSAWIALTVVMLVVMVVSTTYNYLNKFQTASFVPTRSQEDSTHYLRYYYHNTLTRCSPFFVGMFFGYLLNMFKNKEVHMARWFVALCWSCAVVVSAGIIYSSYPVLQMDWDSLFWDGIINSFARPGWAVCVGWMIFACTHGYGGPVNWFLSLRMWKLPSRLSYAMYIFHYSIMVIVNSTSVSASHFSVERLFYRFLADFVSVFIIAFIATVLIDSPFSTLIKLAIGGSKTETVKTKQGCADEHKQ